MKKIILFMLSIMMVLFLLFLYKEYKLPSVKSCYQAEVVYLKPLYGGEFSDNELKKYSNILVVHSVKQFRYAADNKILPIWIDKTCFEKIDLQWVELKLRQYYPVVVVGYGNADYPFRNIPIGRKGPGGPLIDAQKYKDYLNKIKKENGISVCKKKPDENIANWGAFTYGFKGEPLIEETLMISRKLLYNQFIVSQ